MPTRIHFGRGVIDKYKDDMGDLGKKAFIITGQSSSKKNGSLKELQDALESLKIDYVIFDEVEENPSLETVEKATSIGKKEKVDFVIGLGGGSPLDAAKAIAVFIKNPHINADNIFSHSNLQGLPIVAIPTTSGTGSEVTPYAILTVHKEKTKRNISQPTFPEVAYLDSSFTDDLAFDITVSTAIDAFTHLLESYLNIDATDLTDMYAEKGFELFNYCLNAMLNKELTSNFRDKIMLVSMYGGINIAQVGTSLPHGMGYALTYNKGLPHGLANGILTVEYLRLFKEKNNRDKVNRMLQLIGVVDLDHLDEVFISLFQLDDLKVTPEEIKDYAQAFTQNKEKLKKHPEDVDSMDIYNVYKNSLKKFTQQ